MLSDYPKVLKALTLICEKFGNGELKVPTEDLEEAYSDFEKLLEKVSEEELAFIAVDGTEDTERLEALLEEYELEDFNEFLNNYLEIYVFEK